MRGLSRRLWALVASVVVVVMGALCGGVVPGAGASPVSGDDYQSSNGELGVYPDHGPSLQTFWDEDGRWHDGWCRRGEGYSVVFDASGAPEDYRGDLSPTRENVKKFGPTVADGWIVRCHEGRYGAHKTTRSGEYMAPFLKDVAMSVGVQYRDMTFGSSNHDGPPGTEGDYCDRIKEFLYARTWCHGGADPLYFWNFAVGVRPDASGDFPGGWPQDGFLVSDPWPSASDDRILREDSHGHFLDADLMDSVVYMEYGNQMNCYHGHIPNSIVIVNTTRAEYVCLGNAALNPKTHYENGQSCPGRTLTPQYADGTVNGCVPKPEVGPNPGPGKGPKPGPGPKPAPGPKPGAGVKPAPGPKPGAGPKPGSGVKPAPRPGKGSKPGSGVRPGSRPGSGSGRHPGSGGGVSDGHRSVGRHGGGTVRHGDRADGPVRSGVVRQSRRPGVGSAAVSVRPSALPSVSPAASQSPSASASASVSPSVSQSPSPSVSVSPSGSASPSSSVSVSGSVSFSPSPSGGQVWGSERQGPTGSGGQHGVPGWIWATGGGVLIAAGVLVWWLVRGRYRRSEDDVMGSDIVE